MDGGVRRGGPKTERERRGFWEVGRGRRAAAAAGKGFAAAEKEFLGEEFVVRAGAVDGVGGEAEEVREEESARVADGGVESG